MLSVLVLFRNAPGLARQCLKGLYQTFQKFQIGSDLEFILIDDCSDPQHGMVPILQQFRSASTSPVQIIRFKQHRHYAFGLAGGFSMARGSSILFISHDMVLTPSCAKTLLQVAATDRSLGIVRPTSRWMDCFDQLKCNPPFPIRGIDDVSLFSEYIAQYFGTATVEDPFLIGDAMLVQRAVLDKIGVPDPNYVGFYGDLDFGLRAQRAGFKLATARGAWLHHEGYGFVKESSGQIHIQDPNEANSQAKALDRENQAIAHTAYIRFCRKWDPPQAEIYLPVASIDFPRLRKITPPKPCDYQPPITLNPAEFERL